MRSVYTDKRQCEVLDGVVHSPYGRFTFTHKELCGRRHRTTSRHGRKTRDADIRVNVGLSSIMYIT